MNEPIAGSTHRFVLLDALRGMAAIFVLFRHTGPFWHFGFYRSYLAVDIFFLLSGFVIAFAYDEKLRTRALSLGQFLVVRLIRMYPVYLFSLVLCLVIFWDRLDSVGLILALSVFFLPWPQPGNPSLFALNGPYWSLLYELVANFVYALVRPVLSNAVLRSIIAAAAVGIVAVTVLHGNLDSGFQWGPVSLLAGVSRSVFGIFVGVFLYRHYEALSRWVTWIPPWLAFVLVGAILASGDVRGANEVIDVVCVLVVFPLLLLAASHSRARRTRPFLLVLGSASYPLYVIHQQTGVIVHELSQGGVEAWAPLSGVALVVGLVAFAVALERYADLPLRAWLRRTLVKPKRASPSSPTSLY